MKSFDREITVKRKTYTNDDFGGRVESVQEIKMFCFIDFKPGRESESSGIEYSDNRIDVTINYYDWISTNNTFEYKGREYDIESVAELQRNQYLMLRAVAHEANTSSNG